MLFVIRYSVTENSQSREELAVLGVTSKSIQEMIASQDDITAVAVAEKDAPPVGFTTAQISERYFCLLCETAV